MIYFTDTSIRHLERWDIPDDTPRFATVDDSYRMFLGMHLRMMRSSFEEYDPYYRHYLDCVEQLGSRLRLSYHEFRNVVANLVQLYQQYYKRTGTTRQQKVLDTIGKFERLIYLFSNKLSSEIPAQVN